MPSLPTMADRAWWAYHCLPRNERGDPPSQASLELGAKPKPLSKATLHKLFGGAENQTSAVMETIARVLNVSVEWLRDGVGTPPALTGPWRPRPGTAEARTPPRAQPADPADPLPARALAVRAARLVGLPDAAIAQVQSMANSDGGEDIPASEWLFSIIDAMNLPDRSRPLTMRELPAPKKRGA